MLMLRRGGLIESLRGRQGGHRLARPASQITLLEIVEALEGSDDARDKGGNRHIADSVVARELWAEARQCASAVLRQTTLAILTERRNALVATSYVI